MRTKENIILVILLALIIVFAFLPKDLFPKVLLMLNPDFKHFIAFFTLSIYMFYFQKWNIKKIFIFIMIFGLMIEVFQFLLTTTRTFSLVDVLDDFFGFIGFLFCIILVSFWTKKSFLKKV